jgi:hypothetical protein
MVVGSRRRSSSTGVRELEQNTPDDGRELLRFSARYSATIDVAHLVLAEARPAQGVEMIDFRQPVLDPLCQPPAWK